MRMLGEIPEMNFNNGCGIGHTIAGSNLLAGSNKQQQMTSICYIDKIKILDFTSSLTYSLPRSTSIASID